MTRSAHVPCLAVAIAAAALGACIDEPIELEAETETAAALANREVRLRKIWARDLNEPADEIYLTAKQATSTTTYEIRPVDPDYWLFESPGVRTMNIHVATVLGNGTRLTVQLMEQDNANLGDAHDLLGEVDIFQTSAGLQFSPIGATSYLGTNADGWHVIAGLRFGADYRIYLDI